MFNLDLFKTAAIYKNTKTIYVDLGFIFKMPNRHCFAEHQLPK